MNIAGKYCSCDGLCPFKMAGIKKISFRKFHIDQEFSKCLEEVMFSVLFFLFFFELSVQNKTGRICCGLRP